MVDAEQLAALLAKVRAGDQEAAAILVKQYEPLIRRAVRMRLEDQKLRRAFDSVDVCQSVLGSFFAGAAQGEFNLQEPHQLINLLITMTRNKVASAARREHRQKRDQRRVTEGDNQQLAALAGSEPTPSVVLAGRELVDRAKSLLNEEELQIAELRGEGCSWDEIAAKMGGTSQARRVQFARSLKRVAGQLGNDNSRNE